MAAIQPIKELTTRAARRAFDRESKKVEPYLVDIECKFEHALFNAPKDIEYQTIYDTLLEVWNDFVDRLLLTFELKYAAVDIHHFARMYKPRQNEKAE